MDATGGFFLGLFIAVIIYLGLFALAAGLQGCDYGDKLNPFDDACKGSGEAGDWTGEQQELLERLVAQLIVDQYACNPEKAAQLAADDLEDLYDFYDLVELLLGDETVENQAELARIRGIIEAACAEQLAEETNA